MNKEAIMQFRTTKEQHKALQKRARQLKIRPSGAMREALALYLRSDQPFIDRDMMDELKIWRKDLWRVGTNLNQIAWHLNIGDFVATEELRIEHENLQLAFKHVAIAFKDIRELLRDHSCYYW